MVVCIGDTHFPYVNQKQLGEVLRFIKKEKPSAVFQMGDLYDFYSFSRYAKSLNLSTPAYEVQEGRIQAEDMWKQIRAAVPRAKKYQLLGNHDDRVSKLMFSKAPELEALMNMFDYRRIWRFDGVDTQQDSRSEITLTVNGEPTVFHHGHRAKLGDHVRFNQMNTVVGHSHLGGVVWHKYRGKALWELNAGYCADAESIPLAYTAQKIGRSVAGFGVIDEHGPRFIGL